MEGAQKIKWIGLGLIIVSAISIAMLTFLLPDQIGRLPFRIGRLLVTCVFAFLLIRGISWVRWFVGVMSLISAMMSFAGIGSVGLFSIFGFWMIIMGVFYLAVAYFLFFDSEVSAHFC